jgi:hypothetical protein
MKQLKLTFLISVFAIFMANAQWLSFSKNKAVKYQNAVRSYYELNLLSLDRELSRSAQLWAEEMAETDDFLFSPYEFGETIYRLNKKEFFEPKNSYLDAAVAWIQAYEEPEYYQTLCVDCAFVGYGKAENESYIYIVAKYDKLYK